MARPRTPHAPCVQRGGGLLLTEPNDLPDQNAAFPAHALLDAAEDAHAVLVGPVVEDVAQPVHVRPGHRVLLEEVVDDEPNPPFREGRGILERPYLALGLADGRRAVLEDEVELRVEVR